MQKRYQFFISSTFTDLRKERQSVQSAVLALEHIPAGMELFPAADESSWDLIKRVIDESDYYLLIVGGRYGSTDSTGLSYTEREYNYAHEREMPVLAFLHADPAVLLRDAVGSDDSALRRLQEFRARLSERHTLVHWTSPGDLKSKVILSITSEVRRRPRIGWVRADHVPTDATLAQMLKLQDRVADLQKQLGDSASPPPDTQDLEQGDDLLHLHVKQRKPGEQDDEEPTKRISTTWNDIFAALSPFMISEVPEVRLYTEFDRFVDDRVRRKPGKRHTDAAPGGVSDYGEFHTCIVQFRALGLIRPSKRARAAKDADTYWTLTPWGDRVMTNLRAKRRDGQ